MEFRTDADGVTLSGEEAGQGSPVVLLHGLTATRRYVVMGSRALERSGHRVIAYDARAHGQSAPARDPKDYGYERLAQDLEAILDDRGIDRAVLAGASMGAHTLIKFALDHPERVAGLVVMTPAYDPEDRRPDAMDRWDRLSDGLRNGGVEGFVAAYGTPDVPEKWLETIDRVLHQRLAAHEHPDALADALKAVPRSRPFEDWSELHAIDAPTVIVASRDEVDPEHPYVTGERYAAEIPGATLVSEEEGTSPLAWQGAQVSKVISEVAEAAATAP
ncbi:alpha/beta hydrolase [Solirubrobacter ginsenosidimutans]|uniref:Alpha/beta hydrolase n=1 Tax=Solirubrobacter ginsenosidimutans TaxID=490573 RepID=A0A9X3S2V9_9ACTN|nr:alpha/beta hydrolase [Solirubrobacter ginsenosidimutans]MDA0163934.1 alpha/beta hydrolase [Solirubrobacter ginsenosidimutans]